MANRVLSKFANKNPLCCQFTYNFDLFENYYTGRGPSISNDEYFANFYVVNKVEWFQELRRKTTKEIYHVGVGPHGASSNCGEVTIFDQG